MTSSRAYNVPPLTPSDTNLESPLSTSSKAILSSLECLNDYIQKHYDRFVAHESLKRILLATSFAEKKRSYEREITTLKAIHTDIAGLLAREQATNTELRQKLDNATGSMARLCEVVADANFVFIDREQAPHGIKQEESSQESMNMSDVIIRPNAVISALLSQIEVVVTEMNAQDSAGLLPPIDLSPCHSITGALGKIVDVLLATQRTFVLIQENFKSVDAARVDAERQNASLQEKIVLLQGELKQARSGNKRVSQELVAVKLEREEHICQPPAPAYPTPAPQDEFPASLPSPPLEKRDLPTPDDILQETRKISRKTNQALPRQIKDTPPFPKTSVLEAGPSSASASTESGRRKISFNDAVKLVQANPTPSTTQSGPLKPPTVHDDQQTTGPSAPPHTPTQGIKRTSSGVHKCQNISFPLTPATFSTPDKTSNPHTKKKRRISGTSDTVNRKYKSPSGTPSKTAITTHTPTPARGPSSGSSSKCTATPFPKTNASDLKSLKFNKKSQPNKPTSTPAPRPIATPTKSDRPPMRPLELAKKSPQERAAMRKSK